MTTTYSEAPYRKELYDFVAERLNGMAGVDEQEDYLRLVVQVACGFWTFRVRDHDDQQRRYCLHELGGMLHSVLLNNRGALGVADNIKMRTKYVGGHAHMTFFINGANAGTLVCRLSETDTLGRAMFGVEMINEEGADHENRS